MKMVGYPTKKVKHENKGLYLGNKGMSFEDEINQSNEYYLVHDKAVIHKKPTPVTVVKTESFGKRRVRINEAYYVQPSTTDYNGIYRGKYIDFEAKQIASKVSFPFAFIHAHQVKHLKAIVAHGGIGFVLLRFSHYQETYLIDAKDLVEKYEDSDCKSLTYIWVKENGIFIPTGYRPLLDYLKAVDAMYFKGE